MSFACASVFTAERLSAHGMQWLDSEFTPAASQSARTAAMPSAICLRDSVSGCQTAPQTRTICGALSSCASEITLRLSSMAFLRAASPFFRENPPRQVKRWKDLRSEAICPIWPTLRPLRVSCHTVMPFYSSFREFPSCCLNGHTCRDGMDGELIHFRHGSDGIHGKHPKKV